MGRNRMDPMEKLKKYVVKPSGCHEWTGAVNNCGYGFTTVFEDGRRKVTTAHRALMLAKLGYLPADVVVMHKCDNPLCINLEHLMLGSMSDNTQDMIRKGRAAWQRPGYHHMGGRPHKLTPAQEAEIVASEEDVEALAFRLGVDRSTVFRIRSRARARANR